MRIAEWPEELLKKLNIDIEIPPYQWVSINYNPDYAEAHIILTPKTVRNVDIDIRITVLPLDVLLVNKIIIIPETPEDLRHAIAYYLKWAGVTDEEEIDYWASILYFQAKRHNPVAVYNLLSTAGLKFRLIRDVFVGDPCADYVKSNFGVPDDAVSLWKWKKTRKIRWHHYKGWELEVLFSPKLKKLIFIYEERGSDIRETSVTAEAAVLPPGGVTVARARGRVVCGPDGYADETTETITL